MRKSISPQTCGFRPADVVDALSDLRDGPKRLYRYLCRRIGKNEYCWPAVSTVARDLGKSVRQVQYDAKKLEHRELIWRQSGGPGRTTRYYALDNPIFHRGADAEE
jgi:hypothetical protein